MQSSRSSQHAAAAWVACHSATCTYNPLPPGSWHDLLANGELYATSAYCGRLIKRTFVLTCAQWNNQWPYRKSRLRCVRAVRLVRVIKEAGVTLGLCAMRSKCCSCVTAAKPLTYSSAADVAFAAKSMAMHVRACAAQTHAARAAGTACAHCTSSGSS